jgi:ketosteroid isomerase-like protein
MPEEPRTPDLVELVRRSFEAVNRADLNAWMGFWAPEAVWDFSPIGVGTFEGLAAIRGMYEDWVGGYDGYQIEPSEILDLGNDVVLAVTTQTGTPAGSAASTQEVWAYTGVFAGRKFARVVAYGSDVEQARAAAERLAEERG